MIEDRLCGQPLSEAATEAIERAIHLIDERANSCDRDGYPRFRADDFVAIFRLSQELARRPHAGFSAR